MSYSYEEIMEYINKNDVNISKVIDMIHNSKSLGTIQKAIVYQSIPNDKTVEYLLAKPQHFEELVRSLPREVFKKVLEEINDDAYKAKLLIFSEIGYVSGLISYLEDDYFKKLVYQNVYDVMQKRETLEEIIDSYSNLKEYIMESSLPEDKKTSSIIHIKDNDMKQALLSVIKNKENRDNIIQSMTCKISPEIEEYALLAQKMILSFFQTNGNLTQEMKERMQIVLKTTNIKFADVLVTDEEENKKVAGIANHYDKQIILRNDLKDDPMSVLQVLLHEYAHMFSNANFLLGERIQNKIIEEGIADIFSDIVLKDYFEKNEKIELKSGETLTSQTKSSFSQGYVLYNAWVRSMMYPFQKDHKDIVLITQYLLGDKNLLKQEFNTKDLINDKELIINSSKKEIDYGTGYIILSRLYERYQEAYQEIDSSSVYAKNNFIFPIFEAQNQLEGKGIHVVKMFDHKEQLDAITVANSYYQDKKLYEITGEEYKKFVALSNIPELSNSKTFVRQFDQYIQAKFSELTEEEIQNHSADILKSGIVLMRASERIDSKISDVFEQAMNHELEKSKKLTKLNQFDECLDIQKKIFDEFHLTFSKQTSPEGEQLSEKVKDFGEKVMENLGVCLENYRVREDELYQLLVNQKSFGKKLIERAKKVKMRIGEVLAKTFSFEKDRHSLDEKDEPKL